MADDADAIVVGAGLAGTVAAGELVDAGRTVVLVDQEPVQNLGGQAYWSLGGLFFVGSPEQRRLGIKDSRELAPSSSPPCGRRAATARTGSPASPHRTN
jgi:predicted oxidoreductase